MNHYKWLEDNLMTFFSNLGLDTHVYNNGLINANGDKCYSYKSMWEDAGVHFYHGVALYLMCLCHPYSTEVRATKNGFVCPGKWVIDNYHRFKDLLPPV